MPEAAQKSADAKRQAEETAAAATDNKPGKGEGEGEGKGKGKPAASSDVHVDKSDVRVNNIAALAARLQGEPSLQLDCRKTCICKSC